VITWHPESIIWERCPACMTHKWDRYDLMMAECGPLGTEGTGNVRTAMRFRGH
jgi:hypothetical protein